MCYHASNPKSERLNDRIGTRFTVKDYPHYYHASGFSHPDFPVVTMGHPDTVEPAMWGLIPFWVKDQATAFETANKTLNATCEKMFDTPMYRNSAPKHRCLIFVDGFFEWKWVDHGKKVDKVPHFIYMPGHEPFAFGGLYSDWVNPDGVIVTTFSIITTPANIFMAEIHNSKKRMPFIIDESNWDQWLDPASTREQIQGFTVPYPEGKLCAHEISRDITKRGYDTNVPEIQQPVTSAPKDTLF